MFEILLDSNLTLVGTVWHTYLWKIVRWVSKGSHYVVLLRSQIVSLGGVNVHFLNGKNAFSSFLLYSKIVLWLNSLFHLILTHHRTRNIFEYIINVINIKFVSTKINTYVFRFLTNPIHQILSLSKMWLLYKI